MTESSVGGKGISKFGDYEVQYYHQTEREAGRCRSKRRKRIQAGRVRVRMMLLFPSACSDQLARRKAVALKKERRAEGCCLTSSGRGCSFSERVSCSAGASSRTHILVLFSCISCVSIHHVGLINAHAMSKERETHERRKLGASKKHVMVCAEYKYRSIFLLPLNTLKSHILCHDDFGQ